MPLTGQETVLSASLKTSIVAELSKLGNAAFDPKSVEALSTGIANALLPFLVANIQVSPGIVVATSGGPGSTTSPGTIT